MELVVQESLFHIPIGFPDEFEYGISLRAYMIYSAGRVSNELITFIAKAESIGYTITTISDASNWQMLVRGKLTDPSKCPKHQKTNPPLPSQVQVLNLTENLPSSLKRLN